MENWYIPYQTAHLPEAQKVWVLAPHPDDEVFGCAGALMSYVARQAQVSVMVVSSGTGYAQDDAATHIQTTREAETNAALKLMGLEPAKFLQKPDRGLGHCIDLPQVFLTELQQHAFDVILVPSLEEVHPDHLAVTRALLAAIELFKAQGAQLPTIVQYEVGAPLKPNLLLDLTADWPRKQKAMQCFASQMQIQNYAKHIEALNTFRTYSLPSHVTHAEAYDVVLPKDVLQMASANRWLQSVLVAAETGAEALQLQVISQDQLMARLQSQWRTDSAAMQAHTDSLLKRVDFLSEELQQLGLENERKRVEIERLAAEVVLLQETSLGLRVAADVSQDQTKNLQQSLVLSQQETLVAQKGLTASREETLAVQISLAEEKQLRFIMLNSHSWRFTKPLRWLVRVLSSNQS